MATDTKMEAGILEKLGDKLNSFVEGSLGFVTRLFGTANDRTVRNLGYFRPKNAAAHTIVAGSTLERINALEDSMKALASRVPAHIV